MFCIVELFVSLGKHRADGSHQKINYCTHHLNDDILQFSQMLRLMSKHTIPFSSVCALLQSFSGSRERVKCSTYTPVMVNACLCCVVLYTTSNVYIVQDTIYYTHRICSDTRDFGTAAHKNGIFMFSRN